MFREIERSFTGPGERLAAANDLEAGLHTEREGRSRGTVQYSTGRKP